MKLKYSILFFFSLLSVCVFANDEYRFRTLSPYGGIGTDGVKSICQDKEGFMWVITTDEVFRFDGFIFKKYSGKIFGQDNHRINSPVYYRSVYEDSKKRLFLTTSAGVFLYDKAKDIFSLVITKPATKIVEDYYGQFWLVDKEISIYNNNTKSFTTFYYGNTEKNFDSYALFADTLGNVFFNTDLGEIAIVKGKSREIEYLRCFPEKTRIVSICLLGNDLWILSEYNGLFVLNLKTKSIVRKYDFFIQDKENITPGRCLFIDRNDIIWIGTQQGLYVLNPKTGEKRLFLQDAEKPFTIVNNSIWTITGDNKGNMLIGTYSGGISYLSPYDKNGISNFSLKDYGFSQKAISSFAKRGDDLWFGTEGGGLYCYNSKKEIKRYFHEPNKTNSLKYNNVKTLLRQDNYLWIGMYRGGVDRLNLNTGQFKNYNEKGLEKRLHSDEVVKFEAEGDSGMWIIYQSHGKILTFFSFTDNTSKHYFVEAEESTGTENVRLVDMSRGNENTLWLASSNRIFKFDIKERKCQHIKGLHNQAESFKSINIKTIHYDKFNSCLWIGTQNQGLVQYYVKTGNIKFYDSILKFDKTAITSIISDNKGNLWLGSEVGLFCFNTKTKDFYHFDKNDGIQGPVFYPRSIFKDSIGIYLGGTEGFNYIEPEKMIINQLKPQLLIADFLINNKSIYDDSVLLADFANRSNKITLKYNQSNIGFELSSANYLMPMKSRYKYRLKGYNDKWTEIDFSRRYITYSKLPPGHYAFEAKAANNSGIWGDTHHFDIIIKPAPWNTLWAYFLYLMLISIGIYYLYREKIRRNKLKNEIYLAECRKRDQEENHQAQLRFFANITHDFKTPLTVILGTLDYIENQEYKLSQYYLGSLKTNSLRLLNLVNEIIDFRTVENGILNLKLEKVNFNDLVYDLASYMRQYAYQKNVDLKILTNSASLINILVDTKLIEKIIINLLDNALKYTPKGGFVSIETYYDILNYKTSYSYSYTEGTSTEDKEMFGFVIKDTGIGILEESISKVFDRFYRVEGNDDGLHLGSGIGLAFVKSLVLLHKGFITIASEHKTGTDIIIGLPIIDVKNVYESVQKEITDVEREVNDEGIQADFIISQIEREKQAHNILYVEDNNSIKQLVSSFLSPDFDLTIASNGEEAMSLLEKREFDLVLSDWMMPVMDGVTLCKKIKSNPEFSHIPFILMTVRSGIENQLEGFSSGAEAYLEKPINFKLLQKTILNLLSLKDNFRVHFADNYFIDTRESTVNKTTNEKLSKFIDIVQRRIEEREVDLDSIALEMNMSRRKLFSFIKENTGKSIVEFVRSFKMRLAVRLIVEEGLTIKEVMLRLGIESQSHFSKAFKSEFGKSPSVFLAEAKKKYKSN